MLHFEGDRDFALGPAGLWTKLRDARFLLTCIPDATIEGEPQRDQAVCSIRPGFAFVRGTLETTVTFVDGTEPTDLRYLLSSKGIGSSAEVATAVNITPTDAGSRLHWVADITRLGGLLKAVPSGLIRGAALKTIDDIWAGVSHQLSQGSVNA